MGIRLFPWLYAVCFILLLTSMEFCYLVKGNCKDFGFENGMDSLSKWVKTGHAFDDQPTFGDNAHIRDPTVNSNVQGDWWIGTFENRSTPSAEGGYMTGDYPVGTLTSPKFRITGPKMSFLLGGGCARGQIRVELVVNGQVVREALADDCRDHMRRREWDISEFKDRIGQIRLIDASRKGHINFDDLWGDFTCIGERDGSIEVDKPFASVNRNESDNESHNNLTSGTSGDKDGFVIVDEPLFVVNRTDSRSSSNDNPITGTDDEYDVAVKNSSKLHEPASEKRPVDVQEDNFKNKTHSSAEPQVTRTEDKPAKVKKEPLRHVYYDNFLGGTKISSSNLNSRRQRPRLRKVLSPAKIAKASFHKLADNSSNNTTPDDDIRNLTCKSFLVEIKTGKPWDNDFLFSSNENYQSTRREIEVKVLDTYEDDKDFRGAFFTKFSSSEEPGGVKAYFVLRFRAVGKFLGKLIDSLGPGNVSAAGCYSEVPVTVQCPSPCPMSCLPSCQYSCCQQYVLAQVAPQPSASLQATQCPSPCSHSCAPSCQPSCCQKSVPAPIALSQSVAPLVTQCPSPCPQSCAPSCQSSCCQRFASVPVTPQQSVSPLVTQCPSPCPQSCAPSCQSSCCQRFASVPVTPQQSVSPLVTQCPSPCPQSCAPSCQLSCCQRFASVPVTSQQSVSPLVTQCPSPCPQSCAPSCQSSCCQAFVSAPVNSQPSFQSPPAPQPLRITVSRPQLVLEQPAQQWNPWQCSAGCSPNCAPTCSPTCCQFFDSGGKRRKVMNVLKKESLQEEKH